MAENESPLMGDLIVQQGDLYEVEIDRQIATAKQYPRNLAEFQEEARALATISTTVAESCTYALPRDGRTITGPSARFAELLIHAYRNCRKGGRVVEISDKQVTVQGAFHDLERNVAGFVEVRRGIWSPPKNGKPGRRYSEDMIRTTCMAGISIAMRNAILSGIPRPLWEEAWLASQKAAEGTIEELPKRRVRMFELFEDMGIAPPRVLKRANVDDVEEINQRKLKFLAGLYTAIRDGDISAEDAFPTDRPAAPAASTDLDGLADRFAPGTPATTGDIPRQAERQPATSQEPATTLEAAQDATDAPEASQEPDDEDGSEAALREALEAATVTQVDREPAETPKPVNPQPAVEPLTGRQRDALLNEYSKRISRQLTEAGIVKIVGEFSMDPRLEEVGLEWLDGVVTEQRAALTALKR